MSGMKFKDDYAHRQIKIAPGKISVKIPVASIEFLKNLYFLTRRTNLFLSASMKADVYTDLKSQMSRDAIGAYSFDGPTIIYCPTKVRTFFITF